VELVLEIGPANGDIQYALDVVNAAKEVGAHSVKGQIYDRDRLVTKTARTYAHDGIAVAATQYEDFETQLTYDEWAQVKAECDRIGINFFASVFDMEAVAFCHALGITRFKIASGDITYRQLIERVAASGRSVVMSTGASTYTEVQRAVEWLGLNRNLILLACSLSYPTLKKDAHLSRMQSLRPIWPEVGYSDHTFGVGAIIRAKQLGAVMVEKHFTITPGAGGDHDFAATPQQLQGLIEWDSGDTAYDGDPELEASLAEMKARTGARRSIWANRDIPQGNILNEDDVVFLRPGGGLEPWELEQVVGLPLLVDVPAGMVLHGDMF